jgi:hypothetical protein
VISARSSLRVCAKRNTTRPVHQSSQESSKLIGECQKSAQINPSGCEVGCVSETMISKLIGWRTRCERTTLLRAMGKGRNEVVSRRHQTKNINVVGSNRKAVPVQRGNEVVGQGAGEQTERLKRRYLQSVFDFLC